VHDECADVDLECPRAYLSTMDAEVVVLDRARRAVGPLFTAGPGSGTHPHLLEEDIQHRETGHGASPELRGVGREQREQRERELQGQTQHRDATTCACNSPTRPVHVAHQMLARGTLMHRGSPGAKPRNLAF